MVLFAHEASFLTVMGAAVLVIDDAPIELQAPSEASEIQKAVEVDPLACASRPRFSTEQHGDASLQ
jgi:hypothetical protein